jgi:hypothetical protein
MSGKASEPPLCPVCDVKHWAREGHKFRVSEPEAELTEAICVAVKKMTASQAEVLKRPSKFDKVAYQREYMRRRRARAKGVGDGR